MNKFEDFDFNEFDKAFSRREFARFIKEIINQGKKGTIHEFCVVYNLDENDICDLLNNIKPYGSRTLNQEIGIHKSVVDGFKKWIAQVPDPSYS